VIYKYACSHFKNAATVKLFTPLFLLVEVALGIGKKQAPITTVSSVKKVANLGDEKHMQCCKVTDNVSKMCRSVAVTISLAEKFSGLTLNCFSTTVLVWQQSLAA